MSQNLTTADGTSLKQSLQKSLRKRKLNALLLVAPLFFFILVTFLMPIFEMLTRSVENSITSQILPTTVVALANWDATSGELPNEGVCKAFMEDAH